MRACLVLFVLAGCSTPDATCGSSTQCDLHGESGQCVAAPSGKQWCQYPDLACTSGYRWSEIAGDGLGGQCVAGEGPDGSPGGVGLTISPLEHGFPSAVLETDGDTQEFTVTNAGATDSGTVSAALSEATQFEIVANTCGVALAPDDTCRVTVRFAPTAAGEQTARLTASAIPGGSASADLSGTGQTAAKLEIAPTMQQFGSIVIGQQSSPLTFRVSNAGDQTTGSITPTLDDATNWTVSASDCSSLTKGGTCNVSVKFTPTGAAGARSTSLSVAANPGGTATAMPIQGTAVAPGALSVTPSPVDFQTQTIGTMSSPTRLTLKNTGGTSTGAIDVGLSDTTHYLLASHDCAAGLSAGAQCFIDVQFRPQTGGLKSALVQISSASAGSTSATLTGLGKALVTVSRSGCDAAGCGRVTSTTNGIDCGTTCSAEFSTATVTLNAAPDNCPGVSPATPCWNFTGWSGAGCSGTGACTLTIDAAKSVTAAFARTKYTMRFELSQDDNRPDVGVGSAHVWLPSLGLVCGPAVGTTFLVCTIALPVNTGRVQLKGCPNPQQVVGFNRKEPQDPGHQACLTGNPWPYSNCPNSAEIACDFTLTADTIVQVFYYFP